MDPVDATTPAGVAKIPVPIILITSLMISEEQRGRKGGKEGKGQVRPSALQPTRSLRSDDPSSFLCLELANAPVGDEHDSREGSDPPVGEGDLIERLSISVVGGYRECMMRRGVSLRARQILPLELGEGTDHARGVPS